MQWRMQCRARVFGRKVRQEVLPWLRHSFLRLSQLAPSPRRAPRTLRATRHCPPAGEACLDKKIEWQKAARVSNSPNRDAFPNDRRSPRRVNTRRYQARQFCEHSPSSRGQCHCAHCRQNTIQSSSLTFATPISFSTRPTMVRKRNSFSLERNSPKTCFPA